MAAVACRPNARQKQQIYPLFLAIAASVRAFVCMGARSYSNSVICKFAIEFEHFGMVNIYTDIGGWPIIRSKNQIEQVDSQAEARSYAQSQLVFGE